jgi:SOS response regulatory protein OraA/RecX
MARGVRLEEIEAALDADSYTEQLDRATELLERKGGDLDSDVARGRALGFLTRRGYEYEIAYEAVRRNAA